MKTQLLNYLDVRFPNNIFNKKLMMTLLFDIIFNHIKNVNNIENEKYQIDKIDVLYEEINNDKILNNFIDALFHFLFCIEKGTNIELNGYSLLSNIIHTVNEFNNNNIHVYQYSYGSTCFVYYLSNDTIIKKYGQFLRYKTINHDNIDEIFRNELHFLLKLNGNDNCVKLLSYDVCEKTFLLSYEGISLFDNFILPCDWEEQIINIFNVFSNNDIIYTEFNLKNILVNNNKIIFIDFGLAKSYINFSLEISNNANLINSKYCKMFIDMLLILKNRFDCDDFKDYELINNIDDVNERKMLYCKIFVDNIKLHNDERFIECVY
jgi:tRNA A-37 threonylcarbamoyl transferase component Bud32